MKVSHSLPFPSFITFITIFYWGSHPFSSFFCFWSLLWVPMDWRHTCKDFYYHSCPAEPCLLSFSPHKFTILQNTRSQLAQFSLAMLLRWLSLFSSHCTTSDLTLSYTHYFTSPLTNYFINSMPLTYRFFSTILTLKRAGISFDENLHSSLLKSLPSALECLSSYKQFTFNRDTLQRYYNVREKTFRSLQQELTNMNESTGAPAAVSDSSSYSDDYFHQADEPHQTITHITQLPLFHSSHRRFTHTSNRIISKARRYSLCIPIPNASVSSVSFLSTDFVSSLP